MSAYNAPSGTVFSRSYDDDDEIDFLFMVLDGYIWKYGQQMRRALMLEDGSLAAFGAGSGWDLGSKRIA